MTLSPTTWHSVIHTNTEGAMIGTMSGEDIRAERLKKLVLLRDAGIEAYPAKTHQTATVQAFLGSFEAHGDAAETLAGRVMALRKQGGIIFADLFDGTGRIQLVLQKADMDEAVFDLFDQTVDQGDFVE